MNNNGKLFLISAPSGAGKTTLVAALLAEIKDAGLCRVITYTTKKPRLGEVHGQDYLFITPEEFNTKAKEGFFLEWSSVYGDCYGSPKTVLEEIARGNSCILIVDWRGACAIKSLVPNAVVITITTESIQLLETRLRQRNTESEQECDQRLAIARREMQEQCAAQKVMDYTIVNNQFEVALNILKNIVMQELKKNKNS